MKKEVELILLGSIIKRTEAEQKRLNELFPQKMDWAFITGELIRHRLNGNFLCSISEEQSDYIITKVKNTFTLLSDCYEAANIENMRFLEDFFKKTGDAGISIAGLKGVVFNTSIYSLKARKSNDMDLLVMESDLKTFDSIIRDFGFIQSSDGGKTEASRRDKMIQRMNYHDLVPYYKYIGLPYQPYLKVDVNFHFDSKEHDITKAIIEEGLVNYQGNGFSIKGLNPYTHILHLCVHFCREATDSLWTSIARDVELYKIIDIENTLRMRSREELFIWCKYVDKFGLNKQCYFTLFYLNKFFPKSLYVELMEKIQPSDIEYLNKVHVAGGGLKERNEDFFDRTFDMNYGKSFAHRDTSRVE